MPLVAADLRDVIRAATDNKTTCSPALTDMGNAIATYIMANAVINFVWDGVDPLIPENDPVTVATGEILGLTITLTPSMATNQAGAFAHLKSELVAGLTASMYNITTSGFSTGPGPMSSSPGLNSLNLSVTGYDRDDALLQLSNCIVTWVKAQMPATPVVGAHAAYKAPPGTGGTVTSII